MSEINLEMPGGRYPYPSTSKDERYMTDLQGMTKQFEKAGEVTQGIQPAQAPAPAPVTPPPATDMPYVAPAPKPAPAPQPAQQQGLIENLPELPVPEKPKKKKSASAPQPAPQPEPEKKPETVEEAQANLNADLDNIKTDFEDMVRNLTEQAAKASADPKELEQLKSEIDARDKIIEEKDAQIAKLKKMVEAAMG